MLRVCVVAAMFLFAVPLSAADKAESIRLEIPVLPAFAPYASLLEQPGYLAIALENNGLSPSLSSKLKVSERGRAAEIRNAVVRFAGRNAAVYSYEAGIALGIGDSKLTFPVSVDTEPLATGRVIVTLTPPLASLIPTELIDRIRIKTQMVANAPAQQKVLDYLGKLNSPAGSPALVELILVDAFNRAATAADFGGRDIGDAEPLSNQWLLILTLAIWLIVTPVWLLVQRVREARRA